MSKRILGIDVGTNSLGWAVVDRTDCDNYTLVKRGDVIFQEGVNIEKGNIEKSRASERTGHRSTRKHYFRRRMLKIKVLEILVEHQLCPYLSHEELHQWMTRKVYPTNEDFRLWLRTNDANDQNPYHDRHVCLHERLDLRLQENRYRLGRALYHLAQRRGFLSNRLEQNSNADETGAVKSDISQLNEEMKKAGSQYLGDYFYRLYQECGNQVTLRSRYTDRIQHYQKEFEAICQRQQLSDELVDKLRRAIYFQRPLKSQRAGVGKCTFEPDKPRCALSHPRYEEFRMLSFLNNVKVKGPSDDSLRPLSPSEKEKIKPLFLRKSKANFDFEDIAKAIAGKGKYACIRDKEGAQKPYQFNYALSQGVSGCPVTAKLTAVFGESWERNLVNAYRSRNDTRKSDEEIVNEVWNVLYSFSSKEKLRAWGMEKLGLDEACAGEFADITLPTAFAALSLKAVNKILPFLRQGFIYSHAVMLANIPYIIGMDRWNDPRQRQFIMDNLQELLDNFTASDKALQQTLDFCIKDFLLNNYELAPGKADRLYHPSMIETYPDAKADGQGIYQLGSPATNAIRNPMAMRSLHILRRVVNQLLKEKTIDSETEVHIEYARELNDANRRWAINQWQREQESRRKDYAEQIRKVYADEFGKVIEPTQEELLKYQLWEEQQHLCLYTGEQIGLTDFIGPNPRYDIEHTIPQSMGGDSTRMNLTLCERTYNRTVKGNRMPSQLAEHESILTRIKPWKDKYEELTVKINKLRTHPGMDKASKDNIIRKRHLLELERDYWFQKYQRFTITEVPEGFSLRQGTGIGLIGKYAGLFLKSLFHHVKERNRKQVYVIKGPITAEFRRLWGLQNLYEQKSRDNHAHHCIDAIVIACINPAEYARMASYYRQEEDFRLNKGNKPVFPKPWATFTQDLQALEAELLVVHETRNNLTKKARKRIRTKGGSVLSESDSARGSLHNDTYYGAIQKDGVIRYVVRKALSSLSEKDVKDIVDKTVREKVQAAIQEKGAKEALAGTIYMNEEKGITIKKVRCFTKIASPLAIRRHRDASAKEYKRPYYVTNESNYVMGIYEGCIKKKTKREFILVNNLEAVRQLKTARKQGVVSSILPPVSAKSQFPLKYRLYTGTLVLLYENSPEEIDFTNQVDICKRLYKVTGLSSMTVTGNQYGTIQLRYHQEARQAKDLKAQNGAYKEGEEHRPVIMMLHTQFKALVEGTDFRMNILGEIEPLRK